MTVELTDAVGTALGQVSTNTGYIQMLDHLKTCKESSDLKKFLDTGTTNVPGVVAKQAHTCASHSDQETRQCFMAMARILKNAKGTIRID